MSDKATLLALAEKVEAVTGPDRNLDADIMRATGLGGLKADYAPHPYTSSLDAALTLVPEWKHNRHIEFGTLESIAWAYVCVDHGPGHDSTASTEPLALCAAALRVHAETQS
jgi:hypothetical protein